eukprot:763932-Hanusia_phi.AAC.1
MPQYGPDDADLVFADGGLQHLAAAAGQQERRRVLDGRSLHLVAREVETRQLPQRAHGLAQSLQPCPSHPVVSDDQGAQARYPSDSPRHRANVLILERVFSQRENPQSGQTPLQLLHIHLRAVGEEDGHERVCQQVHQPSLRHALLADGDAQEAVVGDEVLRHNVEQLRVAEQQSSLPDAMHDRALERGRVSSRLVHLAPDRNQLCPRHSQSSLSDFVHHQQRLRRQGPWRQQRSLSSILPLSAAWPDSSAVPPDLSLLAFPVPERLLKLAHRLLGSHPLVASSPPARLAPADRGRKLRANLRGPPSAVETARRRPPAPAPAPAPSSLGSFHTTCFMLFLLPPAATFMIPLSAPAWSHLGSSDDIKAGSSSLSRISKGSGAMFAIDRAVLSPYLPFLLSLPFVFGSHHLSPPL